MDSKKKKKKKKVLYRNSDRVPAGNIMDALRPASPPGKDGWSSEMKARRSGMKPSPMMVIGVGELSLKHFNEALEREFNTAGNLIMLSNEDVRRAWVSPVVTQ